MKILVTGGSGFKGHVLVPKLLKRGYKVIVLDTLWFGNYFKESDNLTVIKADIRDLDYKYFDGVETVIHLASIANDPCGDLSPKLTWEVNALATMNVAECSKRAGVKQLIYASSGSVYGISDLPKITEDLPLRPISDYNKTKMLGERILLSYSEDFKLQILRPATVCGISPRMRFDVAVNLLTIQALSNQEINVLGGEQVRPNVHIEDIADAYLHFIDNASITGIFNVGFENLSIMEIAELVQSYVPSRISVLKSNDPRSYKVDSTKILSSGFKPQKKVSDAILEIKRMFEEGKLRNQSEFNNLSWMKKIGIAEQNK